MALDIKALSHLPEIAARLDSRVGTRRAGPFRFQLGLDAQVLELTHQRVLDAQGRFQSAPLAQVAERLAPEVMAGGIFGTNSIEGGTLTEEETRRLLDLTSDSGVAEEERRALNLKDAYQLAMITSATPDWRPDLDFVRALHAAITQGPTHSYNRPGQWRDNPKTILTHVGDAAHGGRYKPPQHGGDILALMGELLAWHGRLAEAEVPVLIRAPLVHLYLERIHPFWDGNGRVGRVLEASLLLAAGFDYCPLGLSRFYFEHLDPYFTLFNRCRKAEESGEAAANTAFVSFHLEGMLATINRLHDRVNRLLGDRLLLAEIDRLLRDKAINARQHAILDQLREASRPPTLAELRRSPWYLALYARLADKTKQRDLRALRERGLLRLDEVGRLRPVHP